MPSSTEAKAQHSENIQKNACIFSMRMQRGLFCSDWMPESKASLQSKARKPLCQEEKDVLMAALCAALLPLVRVECWAGRHSWRLPNCKDGYIQKFALWKLGHPEILKCTSLLEFWPTDGTLACVIATGTMYQTPTNSKEWKQDYRSKTVYYISIDHYLLNMWFISYIRE